MKKTSTWAGLIGGVIIAVSLIVAASTIASPTDIALVNIASIIECLLFTGLGIFLIVVFLRLKHEEDAHPVIVKPEPNSPADIESLREKRNWILAFVLLVGPILQVEDLILNNYRAGFTPVNVEAVFHVVLGVLGIYIVIELFRNKKYILKVLMLALVVSAVGGIAIGIWRDYWEMIAAAPLLLIYFLFAIKAPLNRKNFRIAHLILLPAVILGLVVLGLIYKGQIDQLKTNVVNLDSIYESAHESLQGEYSAFAVKANPTQLSVQDIQASVTDCDQKYQALVSGINALDAAYLKQTSSAPQMLALQTQQKVLAVINLEKEQDDTIGAMMSFYSTVNFQVAPTEAQKEEINTYSEKIVDLNNQITAAEVKLEN